MNYFIEHLSEYFGLFYIPFLGVIISDFFIIFIKDRNKKTFYRTRLFFGTIFVISLAILVLFLKLQFSGNLNEENIIQYGLNDINLGFFIIFFATILIENFKLHFIWLILGFIIFICLFFLLGKEVIRCIKYLHLRNKKIKALKLQKAIIDKKIAIKEELEKEEFKKYEKQRLALDLTIKEKVDEAFKNKSLPIFEDEEKEEGEEL
ncbi:hypothetical protein [Fusobacterium sp. IOR10]|uniref:hypothetical protein n=1 Tax=Fusobacterium sp. IOR10 TaxID=2665157 RepID=UPI0013D160CF|nr:hypothetical protein [Fusobacterium sp. IOR10]